MPDQNGDAVARAIQDVDSEIVILIYSGDPSREELKTVLNLGIAAFIEKGENIDALKITLADACEKYLETRKTARTAMLRTPNEELIARIGMIGRSDRMAEVVRLCDKARTSTLPILLVGETGVGKERIAKAITHGRGFYPVNCSAFANSQLLEAELFGYEKGAFTGAHQRKIGIFEAAQGGVVFLDELDQLPLEVQPKLLRAIRERKIRRVGSNVETPANFTLVTSVKPGIRERMEAGFFLRDLYFRIDQFQIEIPALRERPEDIEPLVLHYCKKHQIEKGRERTFLQKTVRLLEQYSWPGNVGELEGYILGLLDRSDDKIIRPSTLDSRFDGNSDPRVKSFEDLEQRHGQERRENIVRALRLSSSVPQAAKKIGIPATTLYSMMARYNIKAIFDRKTS